MAAVARQPAIAISTVRRMRPRGIGWTGGGSAVGLSMPELKGDK
jgi:hypothetical protein